jgi:hypothetical protein
VSKAHDAHAAQPAKRGSTLTAAERDALLSGDIISRPMSFSNRRGSYIGGVSYQVVRANPSEVMAALQNVETLPHALPSTKRARVVDMQGGRARVELVQGNSVAEAAYTVHLERQPGKDELKFWLDPTRPHDVQDVWGFFRVEPFGKGKSLVTVGAVLDLGPGIARMFFEGKIQRTILSSPRHIRDFVEPRAVAAR